MHIKDVKSRQLTKIDFDGPVCVFLFVYMDNMYIATQLNLIDEFQFKGFFFFWGGGGGGGWWMGIRERNMILLFKHCLILTIYL
jgi:hypothetical protein